MEGGKGAEGGSGVRDGGMRRRVRGRGEERNIQ